VPVVTYKCPACGSALSYDPQWEKFSCASCGSRYEENELTHTVQDEPDALGGAMVYSCPSCGGEVVTEETTAAAFCYYCHNPVVLKGRVSGDWKPDGVLPFEVTREEAAQAFLNWAEKKRFTPKGFSARQHIDKITGVYYPYWLSRVEMEATFEGKGENSSTVSGAKHIVTTTKHYRVMRKARMAFENLVRPALLKQDRLLADGVQPYDLGKVKPFSESYLSGFMAERRDVEASSLEAGLKEETKGYAENLIRPKGQYQRVTGSVSLSDVKTSHRYLLLPAWVVTYKAPNGKMDYYIVNGQTQTTCGILPVDKGRLLGACAGVAAAVAALVCVGGYFLW